MTSAESPIVFIVDDDGSMRAAMQRLPAHATKPRVRVRSLPTLAPVHKQNHTCGPHLWRFRFTGLTTY
jgi:FixJ family two-component response regulator